MEYILYQLRSERQAVYVILQDTNTMKRAVNVLRYEGEHHADITPGAARQQCGGSREPTIVHSPNLPTTSEPISVPEA